MQKLITHSKSTLIDEDGSKTVDEASKLIQSRVSLYLGEQSDTD